ncbi:MAG TPA: hypothetical protein VM939_07910 [Gemmatimonadaceae bacterium]|nr:hypothetical protein [Gemmatimonadaceae bacterium]
MPKKISKNKPARASLWQALDEAAFGTERILNLRESLPSAADARARAEAWLRGQQVAKSGDVLIITGRGNQSHGGVGVIRREILSLFPSLRRKGVVTGWREHTPGSFVVTPAPMSALLTAGKRRRDEKTGSESSGIPQSLAVLEPATLNLLKQLAIQNLELLGVTNPLQFISDEMMRIFSALAAAIPDGADREEKLREAVGKAISEPDD